MLIFRHNAIAAKLETPFDFDGKPFVVQYEVNFQNGIECGGAYVKLLTETPDLSLVIVLLMLSIASRICMSDSLHFRISIRLR